MCSDSSRRYYLNMIEGDVREWINENIDLDDYKGNRDGIEEKLNDELFNEDSVTGNASGSYYCDAYKAEGDIEYHWDLLAEALEKFGSNISATEMLNKGTEWCDVIIRCYLVGEAIRNVLDELEEDGKFDEDEDEEEPA
ncbi:hypothetical protein ACTND3_02955 [Bacillota bacterium HCP28S3_F12]